MLPSGHDESIIHRRFAAGDDEGEENVVNNTSLVSRINLFQTLHLHEPELEDKFSLLNSTFFF